MCIRGALAIKPDMEQAGDPFFFGYGSLVNRATHVYAPVRAARARGWARIWRGTSLRKVAYLSAIEAPGTEIEGLIAPVPGGNWAALDEREAAYGRHRLHEVDHGLPGAAEVMIYKVEARHVAPVGEHPILLSYLDVVVQGYLREFGPAGVGRFFETTGGWEVGVFDDRAAPQYPRAQVTSDRERGMVDAALRDLGVGVR